MIIPGTEWFVWNPRHHNSRLVVRQHVSCSLHTSPLIHALNAAVVGCPPKSWGLWQQDQGYWYSSISTAPWSQSLQIRVCCWGIGHHHIVPCCTVIGEDSSALAPIGRSLSQTLHFVGVKLVKQIFTHIEFKLLWYQPFRKIEFESSYMMSFIIPEIIETEWFLQKKQR